MSYKIFSIVLIFALATLACGFSVSLPKAPTPGPDVTDNITVPAPIVGDDALEYQFRRGRVESKSRRARI